MPTKPFLPARAIGKKWSREGAKPQIDKSVTGTPLVRGGRTYQHGVGTPAESALFVPWDGGAGRFTAHVGVDDRQKGTVGSVAFRVIGDGKTLFKSGVMKPGDAVKTVDVDLHGVKMLLLFVGSAGGGINNDHADWADARSVVRGGKPQAVDPPREEAVVLTPKPSPKPQLNGPTVFQSRPLKRRPEIRHAERVMRRRRSAGSAAVPASALRSLAEWSRSLMDDRWEALLTSGQVVVTRKDGTVFATC